MAAKADEVSAPLSECPICMETYTDPKQFKCGHTLCLQCIEKMWVSNRQDLRCPFDRLPVVLPEEGPTALPTNESMLNFMDTMKDDKNKEIQGKCESCSVQFTETVAGFHCKDCHIVMCTTCSEKHKKKCLFSDHIVVLLKPNVICKKHGKYNSFICKDCNQLLCSICVTDAHDEHSITKTHDIIKDNMEQLNKIHSELSQEIKEIEEVDDVKQKLKDISDTILAVKDHVSNLINGITKKGEHIIEDLEKERDKLNKCHKEISPCINYQLGLLQSLRDASTNALDQNPEHIVVALPNIKAQIPQMPQAFLQDYLYSSRSVTFQSINSLNVGTLDWTYDPKGG